MEKKVIRNFTLGELLQRSAAGSDAHLYDGCLIGHCSASDGAELLRYPMRIDAHLICLCRTAGCEMVSNLTHLEMKRNTLVAIPPGNVICIDDQDRTRQHDIDMTVFAFTPDFLDKINLDVKQIMPLIGLLKDTSNIELTENEITALERVLEAVRVSIVYFRKSRFYHAIVQRFIESAIYMVIEVISRHVTLDRPEAAPQTRNEQYFSRFIKCLYENYKTERSVAFYAAQLHITPKYLTTVIRSVSGRSAAEWIDEYVILEAKNLLRHSSMSIQEVAYALNFPNQSFFGKYFKHHTAMSPSQYKNQK